MVEVSVEWPADMPQEPSTSSVETGVVEHQESGWHRLFKNLGAIFARFFALVYKPARCLPLLVDLWLVLRSTWSGKQAGPDAVYPMLSITKRKSGHLANLLLQHSEKEPTHELCPDSTFKEDIYPQSVAVIDLDDIPGRAYTAKVDIFGHACMAILLQVFYTLFVHVFSPWDSRWLDPTLVSTILILLGFPFLVAVSGDITLRLAPRSKIQGPGSAVILGQYITAILSGNRSVVESVIESGFGSVHDLKFPFIRGLQSVLGPNVAPHCLALLWETACLFTPMLLCVSFRFMTPQWFLLVGPPIVVLISLFFPYSRSYNFTVDMVCRTLRAFLLFAFTSLFTGFFLDPLLFTMMLPFIVSGVFVVLIQARARFSLADYPIQTSKFLDALGHPQVRKWQFDTLAAAATFQCLILCHGMSRPIRTIDIAAFLDLVVPDDTPVWNAWKNRVADRILFEVNIDFAPRIPTFADAALQQELKRLLDQAQFAYDTYKVAYS